MRTLLLLALFCFCPFASADVTEEDLFSGEVRSRETPATQGSIELGEEYTEYSKDSTTRGESGRSVVTHVLMYLPNRLLDLLDIARLRLRVGPGIAAGVRVTKPLQANIGSYATVYAGLPGPRGDASFRSPIGLEAYTGAALSVLSVESESFGPHYSPTEIGVGAQLLLVGVDAGVDPLEVVDFVLGLFFIDLRDDDL